MIAFFLSGIEGTGAPPGCFTRPLTVSMSEGKSILEGVLNHE